MPCGGLVQSGKEEYRKFQSCGSFCTRLHLSKNATLIQIDVSLNIGERQTFLEFPSGHQAMARGILFLNFEANIMMTLQAWTD